MTGLVVNLNSRSSKILKGLDREPAVMNSPKIVSMVLILYFFLSLISVVYAGGDIDPIDKYTWGTNIGWINFAPTYGGAVVYDDHLEGYVWAESIGWIRLGTHTGGGSHTYTNTSATDYGVNVDDSGNLFGFAWSSTVGWINFNPLHHQVTINLSTGDFDGYAWGENIGWIHFQNDSPAYKVKANLSNSGDTIYLPIIAKDN